MSTGVRDRFLGHWRVERHIHDLDSGWTGRFDGRAVFSPVPGALAYAEEGILRLGGLTMTASQRFLWEFPDAGTVRVLFDDGRLFHEFDPRAERPEASCAIEGDRYDIAVIFHDAGHWTSEWRVEGPRKDYRTVTHYRRE
jgi:hypothetical protein